jgi:MoaA/NifB/PqqE/SkfB family radical SAM enzyme
MKHFTIPIFVPELACPNRCVFCNQQSISGCLKQPEPEEVREIILQHLKTIPRKDAHIEIGFFGGSFTGIEPELQERYLAVAAEFLIPGFRWSGGAEIRWSSEAEIRWSGEAEIRWSSEAETIRIRKRIQGIRLSTRPDYIDGAVLDRLKRFGVTTIELGAQSLDDEVLRKAGRGHTVEDVEKASAIIRAAGFSLGLQMMTGLPGDTREKSLSTARRIIELGAGCTRIYPTLVIRGTELESHWKSGSYTPQTLDEAIETAAELLDVFKEANVRVIRVGLHPSESLLDGSELLAGPFHPSFRALVETYRWKKKLQHLVAGKGYQEHLRIEVPADQLAFAIGHESSNKRWLQNQFSKVEFTASSGNKIPGIQILCDKRIPLPAKNSLKKLGECHFIQTEGLVYKSISGHPDIFLCHDGRQVVLAPALLPALEPGLTAAGFNVVPGQQNPGKSYPETARYNAVVTRKYLIHNLKITDQSIRETFSDREPLHVNQGYTRCNLLEISDDRFITSDRGIEKVLSGKGATVLFADPEPVRLKGQKYGFFPGCCGFHNGHLLINGSLRFHPQQKEIEDFICAAGLSIHELYDGPLVDSGGIFVFDRKF